MSLILLDLPAVGKWPCVYLQKTVIRADLVGSSCKMAILSTVAKLEGTLN